MSNRINPELANLAIQMYSQKVPTAEVADKLRISKATVLNYVNKSKVSLNTLGKVSAEQDNKIADLYNKDHTIKYIAEYVGISREAVSRSLKRQKLHTCNGRRYYELVEASKTLYFNNLEDSDTQYWLGYLAADGHVSSDLRKVKFTTKDLDLAHAFCDYTNLSKDNVYSYLDKRYSKEYYQVELLNHKTAQLLNTYGITPRKSLTLKLNIPLTWNMLTGILDGDGSVSDSLNFTSASYCFITQIAEFLEPDYPCSIYSSESPTRNKVWTLRVLKRGVDLEKLIDLMYSNLTFSLARKRTKAYSIWQ